MKITVFFKNGQQAVFPPTSRPGGSWSNSVRYEGGWVVITDAYGYEYAYPSEDVEKVITS